jgi:hypothetical protein
MGPDCRFAEAKVPRLQTCITDARGPLAPSVPIFAEVCVTIGYLGGASGTTFPGFMLKRTAPSSLPFSAVTRCATLRPNRPLRPTRFAACFRLASSARTLTWTHSDDSTRPSFTPHSHPAFRRADRPRGPISPGRTRAHITRRSHHTVAATPTTLPRSLYLISRHVEADALSVVRAETTGGGALGPRRPRSPFLAGGGVTLAGDEFVAFALLHAGTKPVANARARPVLASAAALVGAGGPVAPFGPFGRYLGVDTRAAGATTSIRLGEIGEAPVGADGGRFPFTLMLVKLIESTVSISK